MTENSSSGSQSTKALKPKLPIKVRLSINLLSTITDASRRSNGTVNRRLLSLIDFRAAPSLTPVRGIRTLDLIIDPSRNLWIRLFLPSDAIGHRKLPIVVFFHGGGFAFLSPDNQVYDVVCRRLARKIPAVIVSVNYRLSPENRFPAPYEDGIDALRFIDSGGIDAVAGHIADTSFCFLAGDSAGANISHHVARRWAGSGGWNKVKLSGLILIQPFFGGEERTKSEIKLAGAPLVSMTRTDWRWRAFLPVGADRNHEAANVFGPNDLGVMEEGFPPAILVVGGFDPLQDWQRRYGEELRARGKEVRVLEFPESIHAFYIFPGMADGAKLVEEMGKFIWSRSSPEKEVK
ncbi:probable carboxylesterase 18 [Phalaenopsis equestris]|uniref:probable carboxylesterase 18 n=1 Tax=Phalaenopsis equestris TaxID=78828 RepID=UPI0009E382C3|nr:probable carboxylesterase 18 [Phalaenopsis equestris]XP_020585683.1 probable carboxylesterase 18 [Phalaenopsis equestris]